MKQSLPGRLKDGLTTLLSRSGRAASAGGRTIANSLAGAGRLVRSGFARSGTSLKHLVPDRSTLSRLKPLRLTPIGIDVGTRVIKAAQLSWSSGGWKLHAQAILPRAFEETDEARASDAAAIDWALDEPTVVRLLDVLERRGFSGRRVVLCAPAAALQSDLLDLPPRSSGAPIEQIARSEMSRSAKLHNTAFEMGCWDLPASARGHAGTSVLAVAIRHDDAEALIEPFDRHGVDVTALDTTSWALARAVGRRGVPAGGIVAVADLGFSGASLVLLGEAGVLYQRHLRDAGIGSIYRTVIDRFHASEELARCLLTEDVQIDDPARAAWTAQLISNYADHLIEELHVSFAFASHRYPGLPLRKLLLTGGGAALRGLLDNVKSRLGVEVSAPAAGELVDVPARLSECAASMALGTAIGLAMYGLGGGR
jgi:Tfp pilus assembly PilM family ATPase